MARLRYVDVIGTIGSGDLTNSATSHTFTAPLTYAAGVTVPTLAGTDYFMLTILNTAGTAVSEVIKVTAYNSGTGVATIARAQEGTTGVAHTSGDKVTLSEYPTDGGGVGTGIIGITQYAPAIGVAINSTSTTSVDVDATNLAVSFVVPPSGRVLVVLSAYQQVSATPTKMRWGLRSGSSDVTGSYMEVAGGQSTALPISAAASVMITGLTAGASLTWKWAWYRSGGSATISIYPGAEANGGTAPATMVVHALP